MKSHEIAQMVKMMPFAPETGFDAMQMAEITADVRVSGSVVVVTDSDMMTTATGRICDDDIIEWTSIS